MARSISNTVASSPKHGQTLSAAVSLGYRLRNAYDDRPAKPGSLLRRNQKRTSPPQDLRESDEFQSFSQMVKTGEAEWKVACSELEDIMNDTKPTLGIVGGNASTYKLAEAILQDLKSINFETMRSFVSETLSSLARI